MEYNHLMADANTAFGGGQYHIALENAKKAMSIEPKKTDSYYCAGKACMAMGRADDAVDYFKKATDIEKTNGNGYFLLGYAQIMSEDTVGAIKSFMGSLKKVELIVVDELGFVPLSKDAAELMFQVISECYERKSLIITSNLEFSGWNTVLGDNRLTAALIDRLVHHSHIVIFSGESYRLQQSLKRQKSGRKK